MITKGVLPLWTTYGLFMSMRCLSGQSVETCVFRYIAPISAVLVLTLFSSWKHTTYASYGKMIQSFVSVGTYRATNIGW